MPNQESNELGIIRRLEWDAMHRIPDHEGNCKCYHGHRYVAEVLVTAEKLDELGRVVDFSVIKTVVGAWIEKNFDHTGILYAKDSDSSFSTIVAANARLGKPIYLLDSTPTVENIAAELGRIARKLLAPYKINVASIRVWETPNCSAVWRQQ
jgi:6-pyruvoyltetrahydropterin/6-carboxytetrahydropterin synthase